MSVFLQVFLMTKYLWGYDTGIIQICILIFVLLLLLLLCVIQASTSHHIREAADVHKPRIRGLIQTVGQAIVVGDRVSSSVAYITQNLNFSNRCKLMTVL